MYPFLANTVLILHVGVVLFVIVGLILIFIGNAQGWPWVNLLWFRLVHLATILYVAGQAWFNITCPLTTLENWLRKMGGVTQYSTSFIEYWFQKILFYNGPPWAFTLAYTAFAGLVALSWWRFPPKRTVQ